MVLPQHTREPGFFEHFYVERRRIRCYTNFNISAVYAKPVSKEVLAPALRRVLLASPTLVLSVFFEEGREVVRPVSSIRYSDLVEHKTVQAFDGAVLEALNEVTPQLNRETPPWRCIVHTDTAGTTTVTFLCDHTLCDGTGGAEFHKALAAEIAGAGDDSEYVDLLFSYEKDKEVLPALPGKGESYYPYSSPWWYTLKVFLGMRIPSVVAKVSQWFARLVPFLFPKTALANNHPEYVGEPCSFNLTNRAKIVTVSGDTTARLLQYARANGTTLTPLLHVVGLQALHKTLFKAQPECGTTTDLLATCRRYISSNHADEVKYGLFMGGTTLHLPPIDGKVVERARESAEAIRAGISTHSSFWGVGLLRYVNTEEYVRLKVGKNRGSLELSNVGSVEIPGVTQLIFSQCVGVLSPYVGFNVVGVRGGPVTLVVGTPTEWTNADLDEFAAEFELELAELIG